MQNKIANDSLTSSLSSDIDEEEEKDKVEVVNNSLG